MFREANGVGSPGSARARSTERLDRRSKRLTTSSRLESRVARPVAIARPTQLRAARGDCFRKFIAGREPVLQITAVDRARASGAPVVDDDEVSRSNTDQGWMPRYPIGRRALPRAPCCYEIGVSRGR